MSQSVARMVRADSSVLTGVETAHAAIGAGALGSALPNGDAGGLSALATGLGCCWYYEEQRE